MQDDNRFSNRHRSSPNQPYCFTEEDQWAVWPYIGIEPYVGHLPCDGDLNHPTLGDDFTNK